jgi:hypothetical protein
VRTCRPWVTHTYLEQFHSAIAQFLIGISPVTVLGGLYLVSMCGWFVSLNTLLAVFLQNTVEEGGYGFTPQKTAACKCLYHEAV